MLRQSTIDGKNPALEMWCNGYGSIPAKYMFVGISAGRLGAIKTQIPFTKGPSGRLLQRCLRRLGLSVSDEFSVRPSLINCYLTNFVKGVCLTDKGLNRLPTDEEFAFWWPSLNEEINHVQPRVIIALGSIVFTHLTLYPFTLSDQIPVKLLKHPRWYESHGALNNKMIFEQMVKDYQAGATTQLGLSCPCCGCELDIDSDGGYCGTCDSYWDGFDLADAWAEEE